MDPGYRDRAASLADVAAVVRLLRAHELADHGRVTADWNEIVPFVWRNPGFHDAEDGRIVERDAVPVAFAGVFREDDAGVEPLGSWVASPPADRRGGALPFLVDWLIARAREQGAHSLRHLVYRNDVAHRKIVLQRGFRRVRSSWTMHREIDTDEPTEGPPNGIRFVTLAEHPDELGLYRADQEAFADHFGFAPETFDVWRQRPVRCRRRPLSMVARARRRSDRRVPASGDRRRGCPGRGARDTSALARPRDRDGLAPSNLR